MKKLLTVVFLTLATLALRAQDEAIFMHYINNMSILNPSHVAFDDKYEFQFNFRNQWTGFPGSPFTYAAGFEAPIGGLMGAGLRLSSENIASLNTYKAQFNYAFRLQRGVLLPHAVRGSSAISRRCAWSWGHC